MVEELYPQLQDRYECAFRLEHGKYSYYLEHNRNGLIIRVADHAVQVFKDSKCMEYEKDIPHDRIIEICGKYLKHRIIQTTLW